MLLVRDGSTIQQQKHLIATTPHQPNRTRMHKEQDPDAKMLTFMNTTHVHGHRKKF